MEVQLNKKNKVCLCLISALFLFVGFFFAQPRSADAAIISRPPTNNYSGLVGYWTFDGKDMPGGTIWDRSGQGNHGSMVGMATSSSRMAGKIGQALKYDGIDDFVEISDTSGLGVEYLTFSAWIKPDSTWPSNGQIAGRGTAANVGGFSLNLGSTIGEITFWAYVGAGWNSNGTSGWPSGQWSHLVVTYDGSNMQTYRNGVALGSPTPVSGVLNNPLSPKVRIGKHHASEAMYSGGIDDVRIYNRALPASEISSLYRQGSAKLNPRTTSNPSSVTYVNRSVTRADAAASSLALPAQDHTTGNFLIVWTKWEGVTDTVSASVSDTAGNIYTALTRRDFGANDGHAQFFYAKNINGNATNVVTVSFTGGSPTFRNGGVFQYSGIDKINPFIAENATAGNGNAALNSGSIDVVEAGIAFGGAAEYSPTGGYSPGPGWTERYDGPADTGAGGTAFEERIFNVPGSLSATMTQNTAGTWLMAIAAFRKAGLLPAKLNTTPNLGPQSSLSRDLVGHWTFDGKDMPGGTVRDISGQGNHGSMVNMATSTSRAAGKIGQALKFNGTDDYIEVSDPGTDSSLDFVSGDQISISAWIKPSQFIDYATVLQKGAGSSENYIIQLGVGGSGDGKKVAFVYNATGYNFYQTANSVLTADTWTHFVFTYTFANPGSAKMYIDGALVSGSWTGGTGSEAPDNDNSPLWIGRSAALTEHWPGLIDDVRIYSHALSAQEVQQLYGIGR